MFNRNSYRFGSRSYHKKSVSSQPTTYSQIADKDGSLNLANRLSTLLADPSLTESNKQFVNSINSFYNKQNYLSPKQYEYFQKIESQYSAASKKEKSDWIDSFDTEKRKIFDNCVKYYIAEGHNFYSNILEKATNDPNYIPTFEEYKKICENNYSSKIIKGYKAPAKYKVDDIVIIVDKWFDKSLIVHHVLARITKDKIPPTRLTNYVSNPTTKSYETQKEENPTYVIWAIDEITPVSACKGNKIYTLFSLSAINSEKSKVVYCEERYLKKVK
jgi:hypothetical protein